ncbi:MAG: hypothetical protein QNK20_16510 [Aureibaculum sp.]|nr:hypothetical protein [Aureibaculum sp.]
MSSNISYRFKTGTHIYTPELGDTSMVRELQIDEIFSRDEVRGVLTFINEDYDLLNTVLQTDRVQPVTLQLVDGAVITDLAELEINLLGRWNTDEKTCNLKLQLTDIYQNILNNYSLDVNIMNIYSSFELLIPSIGVTYTRVRNFYQVIEYIVNQLDPTILFDTSGTATDSYYYFKTYEKGGVTVLDNLLIDSMSNAMLNDNNTQKSDAATVCNISLKTITDYLKDIMKIYWKLEERVDGVYFVFVHFKDVSFTSGIDLTNYEGEDWTENKSEYDYQSVKKYSRLKRSMTAGEEDFLGVDMVFPELSNIFPKTEENNISSIYTDVVDMFNNKDRYPRDSISAITLYNASDIVLSANAIGVVYDTPGSNFITLQYGLAEILNVVNGNTSLGTIVIPIVAAGFFSYVLEFVYVKNNDFIDPVMKLYFGNGEPRVTLDYKEGRNVIGFTALLLPTIGGPDVTLFDVPLNASFTMSELTVKSGGYTIRNNTGELSSIANLDNVDLSLANCDEDHGQWNLADDVVIINNVERTLILPGQKATDRKQLLINTPFLTLDSIDFSTLVVTNLTPTLQPTVFTIYLDERMSEITGEY